MREFVCVLKDDRRCLWSSVYGTGSQCGSIFLSSAVFALYWCQTVCKSSKTAINTHRRERHSFVTCVSRLKTVIFIIFVCFSTENGYFYYLDLNLELLFQLMLRWVWVSPSVFISARVDEVLVRIVSCWCSDFRFIAVFQRQRQNHTIRRLWGTKLHLTQITHINQQ